MKERPILFSGPMVRAILDGRKSMTRRVVKPQPYDMTEEGYYLDAYRSEPTTIKNPRGISENWYCWWTPDNRQCLSQKFRCPYGKPGDRLWVRETWRLFDAVDECGCETHPCNCPPHDTPLYRASHDDGESKWHPSIFMPRWASRITLQVTAVRIERLQDISEQDAVEEGIEPNWCGPIEEWKPELHGWRNYLEGVDGSECMLPSESFRSLWDSINGKRPGCAWEHNPWVWVIEFAKI